MTEAEVKRLQRGAMAFAHKYGYPELAEDFGQEVFIAHAKYGTVNLEWAFIDFLRQTFGNTRTLKGLAQKLGDAREIRLDAPRGDGSDADDLNHDWVAAPEEPGENHAADLPTHVLPTRLAEIIESHVSEQNSLKEIGYIRGVSQSRISQLMKQAKGALARNVALSEMRERIRHRPDSLKLEVQWLTL